MSWPQVPGSGGLGLDVVQSSACAQIVISLVLPWVICGQTWITFYVVVVNDSFQLSQKTGTLVSGVVWCAVRDNYTTHHCRALSSWAKVTPTWILWALSATKLALSLLL